MSQIPNKRKVDTEGRGFRKIWPSKYLFTEVWGKPVCLVCGEQVAVSWEYNVSRHYEMKHYKKYRHFTETERAPISKDLPAKLKNSKPILPSYTQPGMQQSRPAL